MTFLKGQLGNTLVELTLALAIGGIISIPLTGIVGAQLRIPLRIANDISTATQLQTSALLLVEDATTAQGFVLGPQDPQDPQEPGFNDYGTFLWTEYTVDPPLEITARYYWEEERVFREQTRGGDLLTRFLIIDDVRAKTDITFNYTAPEWTYDGTARTWSYVEGQLRITIKTTGEASATFEESISTGNLVGDFRPQLERPVTPPSPSAVEPLTDSG